MGAPFVGRSGRLLDRILKDCNIARSSLWISNAALCFPGVVEHLTEGEVKRRSVAACRERLLKELAQVNPKVVIALGGLALETLTGLRGKITARHGALHQVDLQALATGQEVNPNRLTTVIPLFHPAYLLRNKAQFYLPLVDRFAAANRIAQGVAPRPPRTLMVAPHAHGANRCIVEAEKWADRFIQEDRVLAVDVETPKGAALDVALTVFGFYSRDYDVSIVLSLRQWDQRRQQYVFGWNALQWRRVWQIMKRVLASSCVKAYHNYGFDVTVERRYVEHNGPLIDTLMLHHLYQSDLLHNLGFVSHSLTMTHAWKDDFWSREKKGKATDRELLLYNGQDARNTGLIVGPLVRRVFQRGNGHLIEDRMHDLELARRAHINGIPLDLAVWDEIHDARKTARDKAREAMRIAIRDREGAEESLNSAVAEQLKDPAKHRWITWDAFNPRAARQARWFLYDFLSLRPVYFTKGGDDGKSKAASHATKAIRDYLHVPLVRAYVDFWEQGYALTNTLRPYKAIYNEATGCIHVSWGAANQKNFRDSSKPNVQNVEKSIRQVFKAPEGRLWIGADASQLEYRIAACLAGIPELLQLFNEVFFDEDKEHWKKLDPRYDAHAMVAVEVFGNDYLKASEKKKEGLRTLVKRVVYALFYGALPQKIYDTLRQDRRVSLELRALLSLERIEAIHEGFRRRFSEWDRWADREELFARKNGYQIFPPVDFRRYWPLADYPGVLEPTKLRNTPIQTAAAFIINAIFWGIEEDIEANDLDARFAIHLHDAGYWNTAEADVDAVRAIVNTRFETTLVSYHGAPVHIFGQAGVGVDASKVG